MGTWMETQISIWTGYFNQIYNYFHYNCIFFVYPCLMNKHIHTYTYTGTEFGTSESLLLI